MLLKSLGIALLLAGLAGAQQKTPLTSLQEDCGVIFSFTTASSGAQASGTVQAGSTGTTAVIDNRTAGCVDWVVTYSTTSNVSALSLDFQTAINVAGNPGTWSDYGGTLTSGINPNTAATTPWAITQASGTQYNFLRMNLTALTGAGTVSGTLKGWKRRPPVGGGGGGGSGCVGTAGTPCIVAGPTPDGSPVAFPGVLMAGTDGTDVWSLFTDNLGGLIASGVLHAAADGTSNTIASPQIDAGVGNSQFQTFPMIFNGGNWDRQFKCIQTATLSSSTSGNQQVIAASGSSTIRICQIDFSTTIPENVSITHGTGVDCGTGTATLKAITGATSFDFEPGPAAAILGGSSEAVCINPAAAQAFTVNVQYAQF